MKTESKLINLRKGYPMGSEAFRATKAFNRFKNMMKETWNKYNKQNE